MEDGDGDPERGRGSGAERADAFVASALSKEGSAEDRARRPEPRPGTVRPPPRTATPDPGPRRPSYRRRHRWASLPRRVRFLLGLLPIVLLLWAGTVGLDHLVGRGGELPSTFDAPLFAQSEAVTYEADSTFEDYPAPGGATERLRSPVSAPDEGEHTFSLDEDGGLVRWDPCRTIELVLDDEMAPPGVDELFADAVDEIAEASGLDIDIEGVTGEQFDLYRPTTDPGRYGDRWSPVLVTWSDVDHIPLLEEYLGFTLPLHAPVPSAQGTGNEVYVSGYVVYDAADLEDYGDEGRTLVREVLLHELGHLLGLDHVGSEAEVMHAGPTGRAHLGAGDRAGLAELGRGPCEPTL